MPARRPAHRRLCLRQIEASVEARVRAEFEERVKQLEAERRVAEAARQAAEVSYDARAAGEKAAEARAAKAVEALTRMRSEQDHTMKTARASHDSRAAIIATADSLAEEVVRARRERDEALSQLEVLSSHLGSAHLAGGHGLHGSANAAGLPAGSEPALAEGASGLEREISGAMAELAVFRAQLERRRVRSRAAAARASGVMGLVGSGEVPTPPAVEARVAGDKRSLQLLRTSVAGLLGSLGEMMGSCVELCETQNPELWQGTDEQLALVDQIRNAHRLVHMLGRIQSDFGETEPKV